MFAPVYLDHNATTGLRPEVLDAMQPWLHGQPGNASSRHEYGRAALRALDQARETVAAALDAHPDELIFTSGGSEASNLFFKGCAPYLTPGLIAISAIEHPAVSEPAKQVVRFAARGTPSGQSTWHLHRIAVDETGSIDADDFAATLARQPRLLSIMLANNETGVIQSLPRWTAPARAAGAWVHSDAVQALGKMPLSFRQLQAQGLHALNVSAHKIGGPKGVGALVCDKRIELAPLIAGGGQERGRRSGTENLAAIVGFATACRLAVAELDALQQRIRPLRDRLEVGLRALGAAIFAAQAERLVNTTFFALTGIDGETLVSKLDRAGYAVASGSACSSSRPGLSPVLIAMGVDPALAKGAVRISLGPRSTQAEIDGLLQALQATANQLRQIQTNDSLDGRIPQSAQPASPDHPQRPLY